MAVRYQRFLLPSECSTLQAENLSPASVRISPLISVAVMVNRDEHSRSARSGSRVSPSPSCWIRHQLPRKNQGRRWSHEATLDV